MLLRSPPFPSPSVAVRRGIARRDGPDSASRGQRNQLFRVPNGRPPSRIPYASLRTNINYRQNILGPAKVKSTSSVDNRLSIYPRITPISKPLRMIADRRKPGGGAMSKASHQAPNIRFVSEYLTHGH